MAEVAAHPDVIKQFPVIAEALLNSASPQVRNQATMGGNLLQRTRCGYFRDDTVPCNKRKPGSGCAAMNGINRGHAVLGTSDSCIASYPGDFQKDLSLFRKLNALFGPGVPVEDLRRVECNAHA